MSLQLRLTCLAWLAIGLPGAASIVFSQPAFLVLCLPASVAAIYGGLSPVRALASRLDAPPAARGKIARELVPFTDHLATTRRQLEDVSKQSSGYFSSVVHEARTQLAIIQARVDSLPPDDVSSALTGDVARFSRLIAQMVLKGRLRLPTRTGKHEDLAAIVRDCVSYAAFNAAYQGVSFDYDGPDEPVRIEGNREILADALSNLLLNAVQHTPKGQTVDVRVDRNGTVAIRDRGPGIPSRYHHVIFEPFWKDRNQALEGAGLGLHIARETAHSHGGGLTVANHADGGAVFSFSVPLADSVADAGNPREAPQPAPAVAVQNKSEEALPEQLRMIEAITENATEAMFMSDDRNRVTYMNRAAEKLCGWRFEDLKGRRLHDAIHHHKADGSFLAFEDCPLLDIYKSRATCTDLEDILIHRDGTVIDVSYSNGPIVEGATVTGSILVVHDIRERRKTEAALQHASKMKAIGNLSGGMAHDFNNLLAVIIANLDTLIQMKTGDGDVGEMAGNALEAALSGSDLTARLLAFARRQALRPEIVDSNQLIAHITKLLSRTLGRDIAIELHLDPELWRVHADPAQMEAALTNLATNARDAMPDGGRLTVMTRNRTVVPQDKVDMPDAIPGDYVVIEVSDTGTGIPPEIVAQIFEPFFSTKDAGSGSGLGLSMVFGFMKQSGGHIHVASIVGAGTTFSLYLPRAEASAGASPTPAVPAAARAGHGETILTVEDNSALRRILSIQLRQAGYHVLEAEDAETALRILQTGPVRIVFSDVVMPGAMNGLKLAETILARWPDTHIVLTSGFPDLKLDGTAAGAGRIRLLQKPYRKNDLEQKLADILG